MIFGLNKKNFDFCIRSFVILFIIFATLMFIFNAPLSTPDEEGHFGKAYALTQGRIIPYIKRISETKKNYGFNLPKDLSTLFSFYKEFYYSENAKKAKYRYVDMLKENYRSKKKVFFNTATISFYHPVLFLPTALGIFVGKIFTNSLLVQYYVARLFNTFFYFFFCLLSLYLFPNLKGKWVLVILMLNPMALFLATSTHTDASVNALAFLFFSFILWIRSKKKVSSLILLLAGILWIFCVLMKQTGFFLGLLFFLIPNAKFSIKRKLIWGFGILLTTVCLYLLWDFKIPNINLRYQDFTQPNLQMHFVKNHPLLFLKNIFQNFILDKKFLVIVNSFLFYIPWYFQIVYLILLLFAIFYSCGDKFSFFVFDKIMLLISALSFSLFTFFALYITYNQVGRMDDIVGIQGRYFIAASPVFAFLLNSRKNILNINKKQVRNIVVPVLSLVLIVSIYTIINYYGILK
ncbi:MAG: DUF2142 domain-containing protein [Streptococcaceae bacterium]|jgi:uncharacterized membrane protein|nr:DUF2142 domain-containing protein [Streptococcaceae bacterium]